MTPFARQDDDPADGRGRRFRLVQHGSPADREPDEGGPDDPAGSSGVLGMISARLLVDRASWEERNGSLDTDRAVVQAEVPLISALARIRSEADAALVLTGVIELLARRFHVGLPCGDLEDEGFCFHAPADIDVNEVADAIDWLLMGTVRATDLQGALRDRARARVVRAEG